MRLAEAIADTTPPPAKPGKVDQLLARIEHDDDREQMVAMLMSPMTEWQHRQLSEILTKVSGESISETTVGEWRRARGVR